MLKELLAALRDKQTAFAVLKAAYDGNAAPTEADTAAYDAAMDEIEALEGKIARAKRADTVLAQKALPVSSPAERTVPAEIAKKLTTKEKVGLAMVSMVKAFTAEGSKAPKHVLAVMEADGYGDIAAEFDMGQKTMITTSGATGGFAVPPNFYEEIIGLLTPYTAFLQGNPLVIPMPGGNYRQSAGATRPTVGYKTEGAVTPNSTATLREIDMSAKLLSGLIPLTKQVVNWTAGRAQNYAANEMGTAMGLALDAGLLVGNGTAPNPRGIYNIAGVGTRAAAAGFTPTMTVVNAAVRQMLNPIESFSELQQGLAWIMPQRVIGYLQDLMTVGGENYAFPTMQGENKTFKGYPVLKSAQVPINLGAGTNETTLALVSFSNVLMGESAGMTLSISEDASYVNGGVTTSAFQNGLILIKADMEHDVDVRYAEAVQLLTAVQWGN